MLQDLHDTIRFLLRKDRTGFIPTEDITSAINASNYDLWRELIKKFKDTNIPSDLLMPFKDSDSQNMTAGVATLSSQSDAFISGVSVVIDSQEYPTDLLHSDKDWSIRRSIEKPDKAFLLKRQAYTSLTAGVATLPSDFKKAGEAIYFNDSSPANVYEGQILDYDEFYNRKNSTFLAPDYENPIATIYDDKIEFLPATLPSGDSYTLVYEAYADKKNSFSRYQTSQSNMAITVDFGDADTARIYYYIFPTTASHDTPTYTARVANDLTNVTEMGWTDNAFGELVTRSLVYLGVPIKDAQAMQLDGIKNVNELQSPN